MQEVALLQIADLAAVICQIARLSGKSYLIYFSNKLRNLGQTSAWQGGRTFNNPSNGWIGSFCESLSWLLLFSGWWNLFCRSSLVVWGLDKNSQYPWNPDGVVDETLS